MSSRGNGGGGGSGSSGLEFPTDSSAKLSSTMDSSSVPLRDLFPSSTSPYATQVIDNAIMVVGKKEVQRSFRRIAAILGFGICAVGIWYGTTWAYCKYYLPFIKRKRALVEAKTDTGLESLEPHQRLEVDPLLTSASGAFNIENVLISTKSLAAGVGSEGFPRIHVLLHQCPRGYFSPCISPFPFKLETFLRIARIPYEVDLSYPITFAALPNRGSPWLTINGIDIVQSQHCIPRLCSTFGIDLEKNASKGRQTACRLVYASLEFKIYWGIALWRWVYDEGKSIKNIQPLTKSTVDVFPQVRSSIYEASLHHGFGKLDPQEVVEIVMTDLADLSAALGNHPYFLGSSPGEVDCAAFALLAQMVWNMPDSPFESGIQEFENLVNYVHRMKNTYWPDWDELLYRQNQPTTRTNYQKPEIQRPLPGSYYSNQHNYPYPTSMNYSNNYYPAGFSSHLTQMKGGQNFAGGETAAAYDGEQNNNSQAYVDYNNETYSDSPFPHPNAFVQNYRDFE